MAKTKTIPQTLYAAIRADDLPTAKRILDENRDLIHGGISSWLHLAAQFSSAAMIDMLLELGIDVNCHGGALAQAIGEGRLDIVKYLMSRGADPNQGRTLISAINSSTVSIELVECLVEAGANVNTVFLLYDNEKAPFTALSWAIDAEKPEIVAYLRSKGARMPEGEPDVGEIDWRQELVAHFESHYGAVRKESLGEIVSAGERTLIHVVKASQKRNFLTLFTTGISRKPMISPDGGKSTYAELMIHIPSTWPLKQDALKDPNVRWPVEMLRRIGKLLSNPEGYFHGPFTVISNGSPPKRLAPNVHFDSILAAAEPNEDGTILCHDGRRVQLYTLYPLFPEEREFESTKGIEALIRRFEKFHISNVVDVNRRNVALRT